MNEKLKQIIKREVEKLPKNWQEAVNSVNWAKITEEIGKKYLLNEDEINVLQAETLTILIGLVDFDFYVKGIEDEVGTSEDTAEEIADEVMQKIFIPIGNIIIENIKKSGKHKNAGAEQNLNFILSGGDYSAFAMPARTDIPPPVLEKDSKEMNYSLHSLIEKSAPKQGDTPTKPKMEDLKSKFTI